jgi:hypothetical protein
MVHVPFTRFFQMAPCLADEKLVDSSRLNVVEIAPVI